MNFTKITCFEIRITKTDFERKFKQNVEFEKIHFFTPPLLKEASNRGYKGEICGNEFKLKQRTSFKSQLNFETTYGKITDRNGNIELKIQTTAFQGISIFVLLVLLIPGLTFSINLLLTENYNQYGALFIQISLFIFFYYFIYKYFVQRMIKDVIETNQNLEQDIRSWMSI